MKKYPVAAGANNDIQEMRVDVGLFRVNELSKRNLSTGIREIHVTPKVRTATYVGLFRSGVFHKVFS